MILLDEKRILKYLSAVKEMSITHKFYDVHVHPYEVVFDKFIYPYGSNNSWSSQFTQGWVLDSRKHQK